MEDLKPIIAKNIIALRQGAKMTQSDLAEQLNYSDKAISKWERAESMPDITVLKAIADLFEVPLDYLVRENHDEPAGRKPVSASHKKRNHLVITMLSILIVWFTATLAYVVVDMVDPTIIARFLVFAYALPISMIVWLVFNSIWFNSRRNYLIISLMMWTTLLSVMLTLYAIGIGSWQLLLLGIPGQAAIWLWSRFQYRTKE
ncbi:MAG: helix-turn-helix transcriptional regulator [Oscillospiraceae bacterium]|nr:helix-turn-helix transcriptional regulator [Oscillospiraceae bacterium]